MANNEMTYQKKDLPSSLSRIGYVLLGLGIILGAIAFFVDHSRAVFNYLIALQSIAYFALGNIYKCFFLVKSLYLYQN